MLRELLRCGTAPDAGIFMNTLGTNDNFTSTSSYVDPLDDVFGSAPTSPVLSTDDYERSHDVGSYVTRPPAPEPSDIPRLRSTHITNGYREGIAASKEKHIQEGFDEGYSLGAELGMKAGWCLGALEGIWHALPERTPATDAAAASTSSGNAAVTKETVHGMLKDVGEDLKVQRLFGEEYFGQDGIWLYDVPGQEHEGETTFAAVTMAHPLVKKWLDAVNELARALGMQLE